MFINAISARVAIGSATAKVCPFLSFTSRANLGVEDRSLRHTGILDAALGVAISVIMLLGLLGGPGNSSVVRDVPVFLGITMCSKPRVIILNTILGMDSSI